MKTLAAIHVGKKQLGFDEDTYRDFLKQQTGKSSSKDLSEAEQISVVEAMRRLGFQKSSNRVSNPANKTTANTALSGKYAKILQALWISAYNLGIVRDESDKALLSFIKRQSGVDHVRFLYDAEHANPAIEGLKRWIAREGGVDWSDKGMGEAHELLPAYKVARAQYNKLKPHITLLAFKEEVLKRAKKTDVKNMTSKDWQKINKAFGSEIRALKRG